jgi:hypothetical protein
MNPGFRQCLAEVLRSRHFHGINAREQHLYLLMESGGVREQAAVGGLATEAAAATAAPAAYEEELEARLDRIRRRSQLA